MLPHHKSCHQGLNTHYYASSAVAMLGKKTGKNRKTLIGHKAKYKHKKYKIKTYPKKTEAQFNKQCHY